jgi:uncharacterized protein
MISSPDLVPGTMPFGFPASWFRVSKAPHLFLAKQHYDFLLDILPTCQRHGNPKFEYRNSKHLCREGSVSGYMNRINLGEVHYKTIRVLGAEGAKDFMENFIQLPVTFVMPDEPLIWKAADLKARFPVSYADCFAAATALLHDACVLTGDLEFKKLSKVVSVEWL